MSAVSFRVDTRIVEGDILSIDDAYIHFRRTAWEHDGHREKLMPLNITLYRPRLRGLVVSATTDGSQLLIDPDELRTSSQVASSLGLSIEIRTTVLTPEGFAAELAAEELPA